MAGGGARAVNPFLGSIIVAAASLTGFLLAQHLQSPMAARPRTGLAGAAGTGQAAADRPQTVVVGNTAQLLTAGLRQTANLPMNLALVTLARAWIGRPYGAFSLDRLDGERLRLDLSHFDCFLFVEQLLALTNSRGEGSSKPIEVFANHVRVLRYQDGKIDYCNRQHYFSQWTEAAERHGYVVNITPFLPGATSRSRRLNFMASHADAYLPMQIKRNRNCIKAREADLQVQQAYVPLNNIDKALPSLRNGDVFGLVTRVDGLDVTHVGILERVDGRLDALHAAPGHGVMRSMDFARYSRTVPDVIGVTILRPMPRRASAPDAAAGDTPRGG